MRAAQRVFCFAEVLCFAVGGGGVVVGFRVFQNPSQHHGGGDPGAPVLGTRCFCFVTDPVSLAAPLAQRLGARFEYRQFRVPNRFHANRRDKLPPFLPRLKRLALVRFHFCFRERRRRLRAVAETHGAFARCSVLGDCREHPERRRDLHFPHQNTRRNAQRVRVRDHLRKRGGWDWRGCGCGVCERGFLIVHGGRFLPSSRRASHRRANHARHRGGHGARGVAIAFFFVVCSG